MGRRLGWALEVRPIAHCWLGFGPGPRAHLWALRKSNDDRPLLWSFHRSSQSPVWLVKKGLKKKILDLF
jgi:hypothetical protein